MRPYTGRHNEPLQERSFRFYRGSVLTGIRLIERSSNRKIIYGIISIFFSLGLYSFVPKKFHLANVYLISFSGCLVAV